MIWAKIKAALNSTLGTSGFKPLDKIIDDGFKQVSEMQDAIRETADTTLRNLISGENDYIAKWSKMGANMVMGSYVGTAQNYMDDDYKNTLTFEFEPKVLIIIPPYCIGGASSSGSGIRKPIIFVRPMTQMLVHNDKDNPIKLEWGEQSVTWWSTKKVVNSGSDDYQLNLARTYHYIMIG